MEIGVVTIGAALVSLVGLAGSTGVLLSSARREPGEAESASYEWLAVFLACFGVGTAIMLRPALSALGILAF